MQGVVAGICLFLLPFTLAGLMKSVKELDSEKGFGPLPWCFAMGLLLILFFIMY